MPVQLSIFLTVGTLDRPFNRLLELLANVRQFELRGVVQYGTANIAKLDWWKHTLRFERYVSDAAMDDAMNDSAIVVSHAGVGSILKANSLAKPLLLVPRLRSFGEHFDDHQLQIAKYLSGAAGVTIFDGGPSLDPSLKHTAELRDVRPLTRPKPLQSEIYKLVYNSDE